MKLTIPLVLGLMISVSAVSAAPYVEPPEGYVLVAEDDCGNLDRSSHVTRGTEYVFSSGVVSAPLALRDIVFDDEFCLLEFKGVVPGAAYKVDVVYVSEEAGQREQTLEANGFPVHGKLRLPGHEPGRFIFDVPAEAFADGQPLVLKFVKVAGANVVVSYVRVWSTDPTPLRGKPAFWVPEGPVEEDWVRQDRLRGKPRFGGWEDPAKTVREEIAPCVDEQLERGRRVLADLEFLDAEGLEGSRKELAEARATRGRLVEAGSVDPEAWLATYLAARWAVRRLAFKNPLLECDGLLFVRRHHPNAMHQCARRLGAVTPPGGEICVLDEIRADGMGSVRRVSEGQFTGGTFSRPDLSFDGKRIVFGYAPERETGRTHMSYGNVTEALAPVFAEHQAGPCLPFQVWEMDLDGGATARQLTEGPSENSDPIYLPNGRVAFMSHRPGGLVQCGDWALAYCVFTIAADGSDVRQLTVSKDGEWDPFLLEDGTVGFTRWEYVMKFWSPIQMLWSVRPDGTNPRMIYGSDLSQSYAYPLNYAAARQIPGTGKIVCIGSAHHNTGAGPICVVDMAIGPGEAEGLSRVTPVRFVETPDRQPHAGWYDCPYPLSEKYFLTSFSFTQAETETTGYGIYLLDVHGGKELIYRDEELSALFPIPIRPRTRPQVVAEAETRASPDYAEFMIQDVHQGLDPGHAGQARYVQVVECHERKIHTAPYAIQVGPDSGFETKTVLGTVPVERDGSAYFRVPADKSVFFSVLDEDYRALHTMRSVTNAQPGERTSCVGCHEGYRRAPENRVVLAARRGASQLEAPPWGVRTMDYAEVVQAVLDRHCVACHDGSGEDGKSFDLTNRSNPTYMGMPLPGSYYNLRKFVKHAPINDYYLAPGTFGSRVSPVMDLLKRGHHEVKLGADDWRTLCAWIDCNAPGIGDYEVAAVGKRDRRMREIVRASRKPGDGRRDVLAGSLPDGESLVCYVDCGPQVEDVAASGEAMKETSGSPYSYNAGPGVTDIWYDDIVFASDEIAYELRGLRPGCRYRLGFSWWDHNDAGRVQSVVASGSSGGTVQLLGPTPLPAWAGKQEKPREHVVDIPAELTSEGEAQVSIRRTAPETNAVLSEIWLTAREK